MSRAFHPFTLPDLRKVSEGDTHFPAFFDFVFFQGVNRTKRMPIVRNVPAGRSGISGTVA
jgi:hypothetical protein